MAIEPENDPFVLIHKARRAMTALEFVCMDGKEADLISVQNSATIIADATCRVVVIMEERIAGHADAQFRHAQNAGRSEAPSDIPPAGSSDKL